jgi:hypothetical protein
MQGMGSGARVKDAEGGAGRVCLRCGVWSLWGKEAAARERGEEGGGARRGREGQPALLLL